MKENFERTISKEWFGNKVTIKRTISLLDMIEFVNDVVLSCFDDKNGYMPELMDFAVRSNVLTRYANFNLPDNVETRYDLLYNTDAVEFVLEYINTHQLREMLNAANRKLAHLCNTNVMDIQKRMEELVAAFEEMQKKTEEIFGSIAPEDFSNLMSALREHGELDEKKIVDAIMDRRTQDHKQEDNVIPLNEYGSEDDSGAEADDTK